MINKATTFTNQNKGEIESGNSSIPQTLNENVFNENKLQNESASTSQQDKF